MTKLKTEAGLKHLIIVSLLFWLLVSSSVQAGEGSAQVEVGYVITDEVGSLAVNQETFNTYEGFALSLRDFKYALNPEWRLTADLHDFTLNNRNLTARLRRQGKFTFDFHHDKYRRQYDFEGTNITKRSNTTARVAITPVKSLEVFGGLSFVEKHGTRNDALDVTLGHSEVDYTQTSFDVGGRYTRREGSGYISYRRYDFQNDLAGEQFNTGRQADELRTSASLIIPNLDWLLVSGGYDYRSDKFDYNNTELVTNLGWTGLKADLPHNMYLDYQFSFARTEQTGRDQETDNVVNALTLGKIWSGRGGLRIGYESRIADDLTNRTESNGFMFGGWLTYKRRLTVRASVSLLDRNVADGVTLIGDRNVTRHRVTVRYNDPDRGRLELQWIGRISKHDPAPIMRDDPTREDFGSRVDYNGITATATIKAGEYGTATLSHTYYLGKYENNSDMTGYEFSDHIFRATVKPRTYHGIQLSGTGFYYRSSRDQDIEKFKIGVAATYTISEHYLAGIEYDVFNFDDFLMFDRYYTANIVRLFVKKNIAF